MRIGIITGEYPPMQGGVGAFSAILAAALSDQGHIVRVLSCAEANSSDERVPLESISSWGWRIFAQVRQWADHERLDLINLQFQTAAYKMSPWIHFLPDRLNVPVVTTFHDLRFPYLFPKAGPLRGWIVKQLARTSAGRIVTNHEDHAQLAHLPLTARIPIGSNILSEVQAQPDRPNWRVMAGVHADDFLLAYFGFINHSKGLDVLIEAMRTVREHGIPAHLVIIGGRTGTSDPTNIAYADQIDTLIERLGLSSHVTFTGYVDETAVAAYLRAADLVALPFRDGASFRRGTLMAAIQHGCPIVTTTPTVRIPEFDDVFATVPAGDSAALAASLCDLYAQPARRQQLREATRELRALFSWSRIATQTAQFFAQVLSK